MHGKAICMVKARVEKAGTEKAGVKKAGVEKAGAVWWYFLAVLLNIPLWPTYCDAAFVLVTDLSYSHVINITYDLQEPENILEILERNQVYQCLRLEGQSN